MVEENVALGELRVAIIERRPPPQEVVTDIEKGKRHAAGDDPAEGAPVARSGPARAKQREGRGGERDRQTGERGDADQRAHRDRAAAARRDGEGQG